MIKVSAEGKVVQILDKIRNITTADVKELEKMYKRQQEDDDLLTNAIGKQNEWVVGRIKELKCYVEDFL